MGFSGMSCPSARALGDRVEGAEVPPAVTLHGGQLPVDVGFRRLAAEIGPVSTEGLVDHELADGHVATVDRDSACRGDVDVGHVVDVGGSRLDLNVLEAHVEPTDLAEVGRVVGNAEPLEMFDHVDQRLPQGVALAREEQVDDTERILGGQGVHQRVPTSLGLAAPPSLPAMILVTAKPPAPSSATTATRPPTTLPLLRLPTLLAGTTVTIGGANEPPLGGPITGGPMIGGATRPDGSNWMPPSLVPSTLVSTGMPFRR